MSIDKETLKRQEKEKKEKVKFDRSYLTLGTIDTYALGKRQRILQRFEFQKSVDLAQQIVLHEKGAEYFDVEKKIKLAEIDHFLLTGRFNSVLGPSGFLNFKNELKSILDSVNKETNKENLINLNDFFEILLHSGIYYAEEFLPEDLKREKSEGWLTAYRFIIRNFKEIKYREFRDLVEAIKKNNGAAIEFEESEKETTLYKKIVSSNLFLSEVSPKAVLAILSMKELRDICDRFDIQSKRSKEDTIALLEENESVLAFLKNEHGSKTAGLIFTLKDSDLLSTEDIVMLDKYLRDLSKHIRDELYSFIEKKQSFMMKPRMA